MPRLWPGQRAARRPGIRRAAWRKDSGGHHHRTIAGRPDVCSATAEGGSGCARSRPRDSRRDGPRPAQALASAWRRADELAVFSIRRRFVKDKQVSQRWRRAIPRHLFAARIGKQAQRSGIDPAWASGKPEFSGPPDSGLFIVASLTPPRPDENGTQRTP